MRATRLALLGALMAVAAGPAARADTVVLTDGTRREGKIVSENAEQVVLEIAQGRMSARMAFARKEVAAIERGPTANDKLLAEVARRRAALKADDAAGWLELARWLDAQSGLSADARAAWEKVLKLDPDNEAARTRLGYRRLDGRWVTEAEYMTAQGLVLHEGRWVRPEEKRRAEADERISIELAAKPEDEPAAAAAAPAAPASEAERLAEWRRQMDALARERAAQYAPAAPGVVTVESGGVVLGPYGYGYYGVRTSGGQYLPFVPANGPYVVTTGGWPYAYSGACTRTGSGGLHAQVTYTGKDTTVRWTNDGSINVVITKGKKK